MICKEMEKLLSLPVLFIKSIMRPKIVLFGDSITQLSFSAKDRGFGCYISDAFQRRADVLNRGYSGYNTDWVSGVSFLLIIL